MIKEALTVGFVLILGACTSSAGVFSDPFHPYRSPYR